MFDVLRLRPVGARPPRVFHLWPEHAEPFSLFMQLQSQWHVGMAGRTGLDYPGVEVHLRHHVARKQRRERFRQLQLLERAALDAWATQRE